MLRVDGDYEVRKCSMLGARKFLSREEQTCWAVLVYAIYNAINRRRSGKAVAEGLDDTVQEVMQF